MLLVTFTSVLFRNPDTTAIAEPSPLRALGSVLNLAPRAVSAFAMLERIPENSMCRRLWMRKPHIMRPRELRSTSQTRLLALQNGVTAPVIDASDAFSWDER